MKRKFIIVCLGVFYLFNTSCDQYLDVMPDSRTELDSDEKVTRFLTSGYANQLFIMMTEMMSDNVDDRGSLQTSLNRLQEEMYAWADIKEVSDESPQEIWESNYKSIAVANQALNYIEKQGNPERLNPQRGEALLIRAYHHFCLVNLFAKHYSVNTGETDLGVTYMEKPETTVNPHYERESVAEVYRKIERDLEAGIPLIDDNLYSAPKFHFNRRAALAFAARFNLYYQKYDKVIHYANQLFGERPEQVLRDMTVYRTLVQELQPMAQYYAKPEVNANLLIIPCYGNAGIVSGNFSTGKKYMHTRVIAGNETTQSAGPWGTYTSTMYRLPSLSYSAGYIATPKIPYYFETTNPVAQTGYRHGVYSAFQSDETLLCRAEAYIMKQDYPNAVKDLALWVSRHTTSDVELTRELINSYYSEIEYYEPENPTIKKRLNPEFSITEEQENFLQCLLHIRRIETIHEGLRWFDIKRFGIVIYRRLTDANYNVTEVTDSLTVNDPRRAIQLPASVISAGMTPNPR